MIGPMFIKYCIQYTKVFTDGSSVGIDGLAVLPHCCGTATAVFSRIHPGVAVCVRFTISSPKHDASGRTMTRQSVRNRILFISLYGKFEKGRIREARLPIVVAPFHVLNGTYRAREILHRFSINPLVSALFLHSQRPHSTHHFPF